MNKRIRKKKRVGEFEQFGFRVSCLFSQDIYWTKIWDKITDFSEVNDLICCGTQGEIIFERCDCRICERQRKAAKKAVSHRTVVELDRDVVRQYFDSHADMFSCVVVGPLVPLSSRRLDL